NYGQIIGAPAGVVAIAAGATHSLAIKQDGSVAVWGGVAAGGSTVPASLTNVAALGGGYSHSLALTKDGQVIAWGQIGPVPGDLTNVVAIAAGGFHDLALVSGGSRTCAPHKARAIAQLVNGFVV